MFYRRRSILRVCRALLMAYAWLALSGVAMAQVPRTPAECEMLEDKVDDDCDGLIEIYTLSDLYNIRHNLAGTSSKTSAGAADITAGCPTTEAPYDPDNDPTTDNNIEACYGYELVADLDFDTNDDGRTDIAGDDYWNGGSGWQPIGGRFAATFEGNSRMIANLYINRGSTDEVGLFGRTASSAAIRNLGVVNANVTGDDEVGGLVGDNEGNIIASSAVATVSGDVDVGGLVGNNEGNITASYAVATVSGDTQVGGLVGDNEGTITASYAVATVSGDTQVGGLVGDNDDSDITASYAVATVSGTSDVGGFIGLIAGTGVANRNYALATVSGTTRIGGFVGHNSTGAGIASYFNTDLTVQTHGSRGKTTSALQTPIDSSGIYAGWDDDLWNFGEGDQYPGLTLPPLATGACPLAISAAVAIETAGEQCIHRPVSRFVSVRLDDDRARFDRNHFTRKRNPRITAQLLLPEGSAVRIAVAGMPEVSTPTQTDANRRVTLEVNLAEGPNVFDAFGVVEQPDGTTNRVSFGTLTITLDTTSPTLTVYREEDGRVYAEVDDDNLLTIRYAQLDRADAPTCVAGFSGRGLMPYDPNPANADERFLPALAPDGDGNVGVYCFVAEDAAGNRAVVSSANAVSAPAPAALRLRLRVFLESALP